MPDSVSFQPVPILIDGHDTHGQLAFYHGQLVAVLARLDGEAHGPNERSKWHLEAGFGPCDEWGVQPFETLSHAQAWIQARLAGKAAAEARISDAGA